MITPDIKMKICCTCLIGILALTSFVGCGKIKVVEAPFSFNNPLGADPGNQDQEKKLISRVDAEAPSGPPYLVEKLNGLCFTHMENNYKYEFCPFHNVTQREQSYRWNSYHGILGIWKEWAVLNGTFTSMEFHHGDFCVGVLERQISVILKCGHENKIISVHEPETCKYKMIFQTPYACPVDVFQVYPVLSFEGKLAWQEVVGEYASGLLTNTGYENRLRVILRNEGLNVKDKKTQKKIPTKQSTQDTTTLKNLLGKGEQSVRAITNGFISRHQCVQEFEKLFKEVQELRSRLNDVENKTSKIQQNFVEKELNSSKVGKYKFGELGEMSNKTVENQQRISSHHISKRDNKYPSNMNISRNGKRGETGSVDEEKFPSRHLQDRMHESE